MPKSKKLKQVEAQERQVVYETMTPQQRIDLVRRRVLVVGGESKRELTRLFNELEASL